MRAKHWSWVLFGGCLSVLALLLAAALLTGYSPDCAAEEPRVLLSPSPTPSPSPIPAVNELPPLPSATPRPTSAAVYPRGAVNLLSDGTALFALEDRETAELLAEEYLRITAEEALADNEHLIRAYMDAELATVPADGTVDLLSYDAALTRLLGNRSLLSVTRTVERTETTVGTFETQTHTMEQLPLGSRMYLHYGNAEKTLVLTEILFKDGIACSSVQTVSARIGGSGASRIIAEGAYQSDTPDREPPRGEGLQVRDFGGLELTQPMRGRIVSYFGTRRHQMHYGIDIQNDAGTKVVVPADGTVIFCGERGAYGFVVEILHENGFVSRLTHLSDVAVELQQHVYRNETLGVLAADETDNEAHLHYELLMNGIPIDPLQAME